MFSHRPGTASAKAAPSRQSHEGSGELGSATEYSRSSSSLGHSDQYLRHLRLDSRDTTNTAQTSATWASDPQYMRKPSYAPPVADPWHTTNGTEAPASRSADASQSFVAQLGSLPISTRDLEKPSSPLDTKWDTLLKSPLQSIPSSQSRPTQLGSPWALDTARRATRSTSMTDLGSSPATRGTPFPFGAQNNAEIKYAVSTALCQPYILRRPRLTSRQDSDYREPADHQTLRHRDSLESHGTSATGILHRMEEIKQERDRWNRPSTRRNQRQRSKTKGDSDRPDVRIKSRPLCGSHSATASPTFGQAANDVIRAAPARARNRSMSLSRLFKRQQREPRGVRDVGVQTDDEVWKRALRRRRSFSEGQLRSNLMPTPLPVFTRKRSSSFHDRPSSSSDNHGRSLSSSENQNTQWGQAFSSPVEALDMERVAGPSHPTMRGSVGSIVRARQGFYYTIPARPVPVPLSEDSGMDTETFGTVKGKGKAKVVEVDPTPESPAELSPVIASPDTPQVLINSPMGSKPSTTGSRQSVDFADLFFRPPAATAPSSPRIDEDQAKEAVGEPISTTTSPAVILSNLDSSPAAALPSATTAEEDDPEGTIKLRKGAPLLQALKGETSTKDWVYQQSSGQRTPIQLDTYDFVNRKFPEAVLGPTTSHPYSAEYRNVEFDLASLHSQASADSRPSHSGSFMDLETSPVRAEAPKPSPRPSEGSGYSFLDDLSPLTSPQADQLGFTFAAVGWGKGGKAMRDSTVTVGVSESASQHHPRDSMLRNSLAPPSELLHYRASTSTGRAGQSNVSLASLGSNSRIGSQLAHFPTPPTEGLPSNLPPPRGPPNVPLPAPPTEHFLAVAPSELNASHTTLTTDDDYTTVYTYETATENRTIRGVSHSELDLTSGQEEYATPAATLDEDIFFGNPMPQPIPAEAPRHAEQSFMDVSPERNVSQPATPTHERRWSGQFLNFFSARENSPRRFSGHSRSYSNPDVRLRTHRLSGAETFEEGRRVVR